MEDKGFIQGRLIRRYKRFLADIELEGGEVVTAHCPNSGSMKSCLVPGAAVVCSPVHDPSRKTKYTWEMIRIGEAWVGINTSVPNRVAFDWIREGILPGFERYDEFRREVTWEDSRFDIMAARGEEKCFIEIKNVTLREGNMALFPDSVTTRGRKHLETLMRVKKAGMRALMLYFVQRTDVQGFAPARDIDPGYASALDRAVDAGVEVLVVKAKITPGTIRFQGLLSSVYS